MGTIWCSEMMPFGALLMVILRDGHHLVLRDHALWCIVHGDLPVELDAGELQSLYSICGSGRSDGNRRHRKHQQDSHSNRLSILEGRSQALSRSRKQLKLMTT